MMLTRRQTRFGTYNSLINSGGKMETERTETLDRRRNWELDQERLTSLEAWCSAVASKLDTLTYEQERDALQALGLTVAN